MKIHNMKTFKGAKEPKFKDAIFTIESIVNCHYNPNFF